MIKKLLFIAFISSFVVFASCEKNGRAELIKAPNLINRDKKINDYRSGSSLKIACEGTSLTYGEDLNDNNNVAAQEGFPAALTRAIVQYPIKMIDVFGGKRLSLSLRGYPGDRTTEALERWKDSAPVDICILEYGTNDAYNFGGYLTGAVPVDVFKANLEILAQRRIDQGSWVIICLPPYLYDKRKDIDAYRQAAQEVADKLSVEVFDIATSISGVPNVYSDLVHLNGSGYAEWGTDIEKLLDLMKP